MKRKPNWLKIDIKSKKELNEVNKIINLTGLNTVCKEANCPNQMECFSKKTATFMILGSICSRNCKFCNVKKGQCENIDLEEPKKVADAIVNLGLKHAVITSVTRDDLADGGSEHFAKVIKEIKKRDKSIIVEILIPDFKGNIKALNTVVNAKPDIINHNIETVRRLYPDVRPMAKYKRSLNLLANVKSMDPNIFTKSGLMVGLGEKKDEVIKLFKDLKKYNCDLLTIGQYLAPSNKHYPVFEYIHPDIFKEYKEKAINLGFKSVASGPFIRSSYNASDMI